MLTMVSRAYFCIRAVFTHFWDASETSLEAPPTVYRAVAGMLVCTRMHLFNKRVRALLYSQRGVSAISARCNRTSLSRRMY